MSDDKQELVIIRRRGAYEDAPPKGGVWKIAYADFMTAMMAFFLVMWLLNSLNQDQRQVVASVFNPIQLSESAPAPKGLKDPMKKDPASFEGQDGKHQPAGPTEERRGDSPTSEKPAFYEEKVLFRDPYVTLSEIMSGANQATGQRRVGALSSLEEDGLKGGDAYRDPFDPGYWQLTPPPKEARETKPAQDRAGRVKVASADQREPESMRQGPIADAGSSAAIAGAQDAPAGTSPLLPPGPTPASPAREGNAQANPQASPQATPQANPKANSQANAQPNPPKEAEPRDGTPAQQPSASQLQSAIVNALSDIKAGAGPAAEVRQVEEGLLVSLTDDASFGMFAVGSAEPRPELIRVIDKIGPLLTKRGGTIIIRGHTDNRPYRSETYDNWRLSTARAQMAYYMLVRSGVDALRIEHVEGYAERRPKLPNDPAAAQNRRIEILIRDKRT